ncbi:helix-turn-helix domain containing protein, partial [Klebsiella michiganensis]|uniref:helix-turn-helix domain containing protein n=1 Tax=Klebsiella michiganensis TaxID=1134687 RepID=UPI003DA86A79
MAMFNRKNKEQVGIRQKMVRYAQRHGIKPAARYFGCSKNTIKEWLHRFNEHGAGGLENKSRAPLSCPHKTSQEMEDLIIAKRKQAPCHGPRSLKHYNPSIKPSQSAIYRILKQKDLLRKHRKKHERKNDLRAVKALYKSLTHNQEDVKHLYDIPHYWAQMTALALPKYEYTIRDVKTGFTVIAFGNEYNEQYSEMLTELYL